MKRIGIMTTGGDCSGLNAVIQRVMRGAALRGWTVVGINDGTDGLLASPQEIVTLTSDVLPVENSRLSGSILHNGRPGAMNFSIAAHNDTLAEFKNNLHRSLQDLKLDALILVGGNGSLSLAWCNRDIYTDLQLICIPKTIDLDVPQTDITVGFDTAVQQLTSFCDQLLLTARSHHRWFVVQAMGRDCGELALHAGIAVGAEAILIPEIKFDLDCLIAHIRNAKTDYGIIMVSEGVSLRGHSGQPADIISRRLNTEGIANRTAFPEHIQRSGDTTARDRIIAMQMAECALNAIDNNETYVMTAIQNGCCKTISLSDFFDSGKYVQDSKIKGLQTSNSYVSPDSPLLSLACNMGIYIGEMQ